MPFAAIEQLYQVPGMSPGLLDRVAPALTVYTGRGWPTEEAASPLVLAAMNERVLEEAAGDGPGAQPAPAADDVQSLPESPAVLSAPESPRMIDADILRVEAEAVTANGFHYSREAVIVPGNGDVLPWRFLLWRRGDRILFPAPTERH